CAAFGTRSTGAPQEIPSDRPSHLAARGVLHARATVGLPLKKIRRAHRRRPFPERRIARRQAYVPPRRYMALTVLMVHNRYLQRGGEDVAFETDCRLLREAGDTVDVSEEDNRRVEALGKARSAARAGWSVETCRRSRERRRRARCDCRSGLNSLP